MTYTIYTATGVKRVDFEGNSNSTHDYKVQTNNELNLSFTLYDYVELDVNDYIDLSGMRFILLKPYKPVMKSTKEYVYDLKFFGPENIAGSAAFLDTNYDPISSYYDTPSAQLAFIVSCINRVVGSTYYHVGEVVSTAPIKVEYTRGCTCLEALSTLSKACKTEWWLDGVNFNLSKCEYGEPIILAYGRGLLRLEKQLADTDAFFTRLLPTGSAKNIVPRKYGHNTLQLPGGKKWIDRNVDLYGIKEKWEESAFSQIFPRFTGTVGVVRSEKRTVDNKEITVYYFTTPDIPFNPNSYSVPNLYKHVVFKSGDLLGQDFEANWHEDTAEWELITQYPTEKTQLPGDNVLPQTGDKYTVYNLDLPTEYYTAAEQELEAAVLEILDKAAIDFATYKGATDHVYLEDQGISLTLGRRVRLENSVYFPSGYRDSRITRIVRKLSNLNEMDIEISNTIIQGQYTSLKNDVTDLKNTFAQTLANEILNIIRTTSDADLTDNNVLSSLRALAEIKKRALSRLNDDEAAGLIHFLAGLTSAALISAGKGVQFGNFLTGIQGGYIDEKGNGELDSLEIRKRLFVPEIAYNRITYFKGRMVNSPGGGCTVKSVVANSDGTYTVTPDLTSADGLSQFKDDILATYFTAKDAEGNLQGFQEMKFRVVSADYNAKTFVMAPRPGFSYKPAEQMILAQTGNFTDADRQTYILIDSVNGNNCITFFDNANTWDVEPSQEKSWFGKKKGRTINGIPADDYNAVMRNIIMTGKIFQVDDISGKDIRVPIDKRNWVAGKYAYYDRVSHNGKLWLCVAESGTETEPAASEPAWLLQVDSGASITSYAHWENDQTPYPANTILSFANKIWISKRETSEAPYPLLLDHKGDRLKQTQDGGQTYGYTYYVEKQSDDWNLLLDAESLTKGKDGESLEVRYSSDKQSWHSTFVEGDVWMQQRLGATSWSAAMRIVGEAGTDAQWQDFQFAVGNSLSVAPSTGWQDAPPTVSTGQYLWMRTGWVTPPATAPASWVSVRIGGEKGLGIASVDVEYAIGTSATTSPTWGWQTTSPAWEDGKYIWSRTKIVYTDNSVKYSQEACITGGKGTTGKGISSIVEEYYQSSSPTSLTDGLWTTTRPTWENNKYIWTRSKIVYTDATTSMTDAICVTGGKGESVTNVGRWHTGLHVPNLGITTMGGSSWICKKQGGTDNPPLWTDITNGGNRILQTQDGWKTYGYVLTGERNTEEYDLIASDGKDTEIAYLISTVSNISVSSSGTLVPSSFAVYAKKNKGGTTTAYTEGYLCARGFSNGTWGVIVSPTKASQINVSASTGYAMYSTRLYASQSDAAAWNDNFSSEISVGITYNGKNGDRGPTGAMLRSRGQYVSGNTYLWDEKFRDVILYSFNNVWRAFVIKAYGSSTTSAPTSVDGDANWDAFQQFQNVATDILLSRQIKADEIDVKSLVVENVSAKDANGNVTTKIDGSTGELTSKKAILEDALVQGKIVTALNGKRVEINPANNSLSLFNENGKEVCNLSFLSENWNGAVNSFPRLSLKQYHNTTLVSEIEFTQGQMSASMRSGNDLFEAAFNPMSGITFIKNDAVQMFYPAKKN